MKSKKLLLVEDQTDARFYYRKILTNAGYNVTVAVNGKEALDLFRKEYHDIILTDWLMPIMDGFQLTEAVRKEFKEQPVIVVLTAVNSRDAKNGAMYSGADDFIAKPVEKERLLMTLENISKRQSSQTTINALQKLVKFSKYDFYCVGIAASTGGPSTLSTFFSNLGVIENAAFMVVQHGPEWMLRTFSETLKTKTQMPVHLGNERLFIKPGNIYLAPGNRHMILKENSTQIGLLDSKPVNFVKPSADPLFQSISSTFGNKSIAMVFTGMGNDGSLGSGYISASGGKVIIQHIEDAILSSMPKSVLKLNLADKVSPVSTIHETLKYFLK